MIIYKITNLINGKVYIGQTTRSLKKRWYEHCNEFKTRKNCLAIHSAIKTYGKDNFLVEEIDHATDKIDLSKKEQYWIAYYNSISPNGYNLTSGGEHTTFTPEALKRMSLKQKEYWKTHTSTSVKPVFQYTLDGEFIRQWDSIKQASESLNINNGNLCQACRKGKNKSAGGFLWSYSKEDHLRHLGSRLKPVVCLETQKTYKSVKEAALAIKRSPGTLVGCLKGKQSTCGGYHWKYEEAE